jgi:tetratricopeptide (TPR) repeat protein
MKNGSTGAMLAGALWLLSGAASAAEPLAPPAAKPNARYGTAVSVDVSSASLDNKLVLVKRLLTQAPAAQRIQQSDSALAKKKLVNAQVLYTRAQSEYSAGRAATATQLLDEALRDIASASSLVPDMAQQAILERNQNKQLREAIVTFQALQNSFSRRMAPAAQTTAVVADVGRIDGLLQQADELIVSGNQHEANRVLSSAYKVVVSALNKMLAAETIVYGLKFDSPADEFRHELARNRGYEELIPMALAQFNTARETAVLAERYMQQSRDLRDLANRRASNGDYSAAVKTLQDATGHLQRSLRVAGVVVPQSTELTP